MTTSSGWVTDIQRFSLDDGPGIRTTVFLKGCPLHCLWCHNPECISPRPLLRFLASRCVFCARCVQVCPAGVHAVQSQAHTLQREQCRACGACADVCPAEALSVTGRALSVEEVLRPVLADRRYYATSGGGLTVSGGEPTMQPAFLLALLRAAHDAGISTAIETCGHFPAALVEKLTPLCDLFLFDCKETDPERHRRWTGQDNRRILSNLSALLERGARVVLRCPLIPGCNLRQEHLQGILSLLQRYPTLAGCELMAYHKLGISKYRELGLPYALDAEELTEEKKDAILRWMNERAPLRIKWG